MDHQNEEEKMELSHEPVPGYKTAFYIAVAAGVIYLGIIFFRCFPA